MASSSSLFNFLSFLLPSQITKKNPPQIISTSSHCDSLLPSLSSSSSTTSSVSFLNRRNRDGFVPLTPIEKSSSCQNDLLSVVCPSLAYSNIFFFGPYHVQVVVGEDETDESLVTRFRKEVLRARVIQDCRRRRYHETSQEKRKRRSKDAARRNKRRRTPWVDQVSADKDEEALKEEEEKKKAKDEEEQDNWEYYEGEDVPYY